jgi:hypothetical protein
MEKKSVDDKITAIWNERKQIEADIKSKRAALKLGKKSYIKIRGKKTKMDRPVRAEVMLILEQYGILAADYHGGDLNGVSARRLMKFSTDIFMEIENYLLTYQHDDRCSNDYIKQVCSTYRSILSTLDVITKTYEQQVERLP